MLIPRDIRFCVGSSPSNNALSGPSVVRVPIHDNLYQDTEAAEQHTQGCHTFAMGNHANRKLCSRSMEKFYELCITRYIYRALHAGTHITGLGTGIALCEITPMSSSSFQHQGSQQQGTSM